MRSMVEGTSAMRRNIWRARRLRRKMSPPEVVLWLYLRTRPAGFKYRRQHPVGAYTLDFFCHEAGVAIEVDGDAHDMGDRPGRDERRDAWLRERGIATIRFLARDVMEALDGVAARILEECASRSPAATLRVVPLPGKRRGGSS